MWLRALQILSTREFFVSCEGLSGHFYQQKNEKKPMILLSFFLKKIIDYFPFFYCFRFFIFINRISIKYYRKMRKYEEYGLKLKKNKFVVPERIKTIRSLMKGDIL
jgi:hypothetical protein